MFHFSGLQELQFEGLDETFNRIALSITNGNDLFGQDDNLEDVSHLDDNCDEELAWSKDLKTSLRSWKKKLKTSKLR
ncbi:363_t:CDS:2 [Entrophospora sp. SA101]|nr:363_t:CDS:2 [Entrophospora sp. SA101]